MAFGHVQWLAFAGLLLQCSVPAAAQQALPGVDRHWLASFSGVDVSPDAYYVYQGAIIALNRDLSKDGVVVRLFGGLGSYQYDESAVPGGVVDGDVRQFDGMLGYRATLAGVYTGVYVGVDYQNHKLRPHDPTNPVSGSEAGFKIAADLESNRERTGLYYSFDGSYSTAFDSYWARGRVGYSTGRIVFGPEAIALGNEGYDGTRIGGFVSWTTQLNPWVPLELTLSVGHQHIREDDGGGGIGASGGGNGMYGGVNFGLVF